MLMKKLRSGYTTGACAAAAAKAATLTALIDKTVPKVEIPFPDGSRVWFEVKHCRLDSEDNHGRQAFCTVVKDAGDDPDVTNRAEIVATVHCKPVSRQRTCNFDVTIDIKGGEGVGKVTKPGLAVKVGEAAINPVPRKMIHEAVFEAFKEAAITGSFEVMVEIGVPRGKILAKKTLNERLGIVGGISILGTTGIVKPVSADAWTATITAAMDVAAAAGNKEIVFSTGRTSEAAIQKQLQLPEDAYIMMGDYLEYALKETKKYNFTKIHLSGMWAKILKGALRIPQTHVRFGALQMEQAIELICQLNPGKDYSYLEGSNTAREIYGRLIEKKDQQAVNSVCEHARKYHQEISNSPVAVYLIHHSGRIVASAG